MEVIFGSARIDENGKITGGAAGDQTGKEVSTQKAYWHSKGWYVLRPEDAGIASMIAIAMMQACSNNNVGYDQNSRLGIVSDIVKYKTMDKIVRPTEADCSSLVRACCMQVGFDPGNFTTWNEADVLESTGMFEKRFELKSFDELYEGDVLVTKKKGHTVIVVNGKERESTLATAQYMLKQVLGIVPGNATMADVNNELKKALGIETPAKPSNNTVGCTGATSDSTATGCKYVVGSTYTLQADAVRVRTAPGTDSKVKSYDQLTENAKKNAYASGTLKAGTRVTCKEVRTIGNDIWIRIPSGWIAAYYDGKAFVV